MNEITLSSFLSRLNERNKKTEKYHRNENIKQKKEPILKRPSYFVKMTPPNFYYFFEITISDGLAF